MIYHVSEALTSIMLRIYHTSKVLTPIMVDAINLPCVKFVLPDYGNLLMLFIYNVSQLLTIL